MTITTAQPVAVPSMNLLLSGLVWSATPGTATTVTYDFLTQAPTTLLLPVAGDPSEGTGWAPLTPAEQGEAVQAFAEISAVANISFQASTDAATADVLIGTNNQTVTAGYTSFMGTPQLSGGRYQLTQTHIEIANNEAFFQNEFWTVILHEMANSTGLQDLAGDTNVGQPQNSLTYSIESYASGANGFDDFSPGGVQATTPQILDVLAWQYLYGANENGFTPSTVGVTHSAAGNNHTYAFTDQTAPMTVWIGSKASGVNCFDFSACTGQVTIDLTPGTVSSTGQNSPTEGYGFANIPYQNVGIAFHTTIQIGIADATAGATLIADANAGTADLLIGGAKAADSFVAGGGYDIFVAAGGADTAEFHDTAANYKITTGADGDLIVTDMAAKPSDGTVVLVGNFTALEFSDQTVSESPAAPTSATSGLSILSTAASAQTYLDTLQGFASKGYVSTILLTDSGIPAVSVTAAQTVTDAQAIADLSGSYSLSVDASAADAVVDGPGGGHAVIAVLPGTAASYSLSGTGNGVAFTLTDGTGTDHMSQVTELRFSDAVAFIASQTATISGGVTSAQVADLYAGVLARTPDAAGLAYYENLAATTPGLTIVTVAEYFLGSPEYTAAHNYAQTPAGDAQFVTDTYQNLLHRAPGGTDVAWYQANVIDPILGKTAPGTSAYTQAEFAAHAQLLTDFSQSPEFLSDVQVTGGHPADAQHWLILI